MESTTISMTVKLDPPRVKHSRASDENDRIWFYEELEGEILDFARYVKRHYDIKYNETSMAHLKRIGSSINNLKMVSGLGFGDVAGIYDYSEPNPNREKPPLFMKKESTPQYDAYTVEDREEMFPKKPDREFLKNLAEQCYRGEVFTSNQIEDKTMISSVFMVFGLMDPVQSKDLYKKKPVLIYSYMKDRFDMGINGYPCFWSAGFLDAEHTKIFEHYYFAIKKAVEDVK